MVCNDPTYCQRFGAVGSNPPTLGGSFALYNLAYAAGLAFGPLLAGMGVQQTGFTMALTIGAILILIIGLASLVRLPRRQLPVAND